MSLGSTADIFLQPIGYVRSAFDAQERSGGDQQQAIRRSISQIEIDPIGLSLVRLISIDGTNLRVTGLDAIEATPVLDIKPYEEHFDSHAGLVNAADKR